MFQLLPIDQVRRNPAQPRTIFDEAALEQLADTIKAHGVIQPIVVRSIAHDKYEIVAGERRWRAAQLAGLHEIPAIVRDELVSEDEIAKLALIENLQREDLSPLEESLDALDADRDFLKAGGVFSDDMIDAYIRLKRKEVERLNMTTHPVEFEMYYSV